MRMEDTISLSKELNSFVSCFLTLKITAENFERLLRSRLFWILFPVLTVWIISIIIIDALWMLFPVFIGGLGTGLLYLPMRLFGLIENPLFQSAWYNWLMIIIFYGLYAFFIIKVKTINRKVLYTVGIIVLLLMVTSIRSCTAV